MHRSMKVLAFARGMLHLFILISVHGLFNRVLVIWIVRVVLGLDDLLALLDNGESRFWDAGNASVILRNFVTLGVETFLAGSVAIAFTRITPGCSRRRSLLIRRVALDCCLTLAVHL